MFPPLGRLHIPESEEVLAGPFIETISAPKDWVRSPAAFVADLSGRDIRHNLLVPRNRLVHGTYRNRFERSLVFGWHHIHAVIDRNLRLDCQNIDWAAHMLDGHVAERHGRKWPIPSITKRKDGYWANFSRCGLGGAVKLKGEVYFGTPVEPLNWGMWLLQALPNAYDFVQRGQKGRFLCYADRDWQKGFLKFMGVRDDKIVEQELLQAYDCDRIVMQQYTGWDFVPTEVDREILAAVAARHAPAVQSGGEKIFISRKSITLDSEGTYRALLNEDELLDAVAALGFRIVEPEFLPFPEQIALFHNAKIVAGLGGAGMFNVMFSKPGTKVVSIESSGTFVGGHSSLFAALGHQYAFIFGQQDLTDETPVHKRWTIDVAGAVRALKDFM